MSAATTTFLAGFHPARQPMMTRQSYARELVAAGTVPFALAMLEGGVIGAIARFSFGVGPYGFAALFAAPMFANLTSLLWSRLARGRRKIRFITGLMAAMLLAVAAIGTLHATPANGPWLVALAVGARCLVAGFITLRSAVWRANFPRRRRAAITSRFMILATLILGVAPLGIGALLDARPDAYRWLFPLAACVGVIGVVSFAGIRFRRERNQLRLERLTATRARRDDPDTPRQPDGRPHTALSILRHDHRFRRYMGWQFCAGVANMAGITAFAVYATDRFADLENRYLLSMVLITTVPLVTAAASMGWWSRRLDRLHIARYRVLHGSMWVVNQALNGVAALLGWIPLMFATNLVFGLVRGGGMPAWALGHNDFAHPALNTLYMSIHQALTGLRGAVAPFLGTLLFTGWSAGSIEIPVVNFTVQFGGWPGMGAGVFVVTTLLALLAWAGFRGMANDLAAEGRDVAEDAG